eukprot:6205769-Pleurochrysis_carterae.AAC.2
MAALRPAQYEMFYSDAPSVRVVSQAQLGAALAEAQQALQDAEVGRDSGGGARESGLGALKKKLTARKSSVAGAKADDDAVFTLADVQAQIEQALSAEKEALEAAFSKERGVLEAELQKARETAREPARESAPQPEQQHWQQLEEQLIAARQEREAGKEELARIKEEAMEAQAREAMLKAELMALKDTMGNQMANAPLSESSESAADKVKQTMSKFKGFGKFQKK